VIKSEVKELLSDPNMYESKLNLIDKKLDFIITDTRQQIKEGKYKKKATPYENDDEVSNFDMKSVSEKRRSSQSLMQSARGSQQAD
jgi:hypothetical protein